MLGVGARGRGSKGKEEEGRKGRRREIGLGEGSEEGGKGREEGMVEEGMRMEGG